MLKITLKLIISYFIATIIAGLVCLHRGDEIEALEKIFMLWLPVSVIYSLITITVLTRLSIVKLSGMVELCGFCIGMFLLLFGWPPYVWILELAIISVAMQCLCIAVVILLRWFVFRKFGK